MGGLPSAGILVLHLRPSSRLTNAARAAATSAGFSNNSMPATASVRAATTIPFRPMLVPAHAAACHVCADTPGTNVAVVNCAVGTTQLTSPASLDAEVNPSVLSVRTV